MNRIATIIALILAIAAAAVAAPAAPETPWWAEPSPDRDAAPGPPRGGPSFAYRILVGGELAFAAAPEEVTWYYTRGYGGSLGIQLDFTPTASFQVGISHNAFSPDGNMIRDWYGDPGEYPERLDPRFSEGALSLTTVFAAGKLKLRSPGSRSYPYVRGGFGITHLSAEHVRVDYRSSYTGAESTGYHGAEVDETNSSVLVGFGFEFAMGDGGRAFFLEAGYRMIMTEGDSGGTAGVSLGFVL